MSPILLRLTIQVWPLVPEADQCADSQEFRLEHMPLPSEWGNKLDVNVGNVRLNGAASKIQAQFNIGPSDQRFDSPAEQQEGHGQVRLNRRAVHEMTSPTGKRPHRTHEHDIHIHIQTHFLGILQQ